jgi:hypothetical protein
MKPGDLIEWVYSNSQPVLEDEKLWSTPMNRWVQIGVHPMMLISMTDELYVWLTPDGLFNARVADTGGVIAGEYGVFPRVVGEHR